MTITIEKIFRFDAGHRALGFNYHKEEAIHGHTWTLRIVLATDKELGSGKTIMDTNDLALAVKPIIARVDHSFIIWDADPIYAAMRALCEEADILDQLTTVDFNPTLEGMAEYFYRQCNEALSLTDCRIARVELEATATLRATYTP
ncbi:6-carboxytetrahydropterin synthase [Streptomyces sp. WAC06614]|uniref:6-pyruvoyl trahydropterin synthase family protein n=1 Tax=Streptomyces sp. WAC06614 TaxID=2487416 RepID=UPI000F797FB9|nr:6-carboxytetrahydropterin synthase [Streptomyces sp. WAC06614]RSS79462.1 6-carboxytetrahydropterin synthase [Streptomyces sp. WAC06614]